MVEEADLHEVGGIHEAAGHRFVGSAWAAIAGGVVVDEDEAIGSTRDHGAEDFTGVSVGFADSSHGDDGGSDVTQAGVHGNDDHLFLGEVAKLRREILVDSLGAV
jgi:hypothetical protein